MPKLVEVPSVRARVGEEEWQAPNDLSAAYPLVAHYRWTHLINNHISLRVPNTEEQFLINPYGLLYEQITASSLVKIDVDGNVLDDSPYQVNRAGFVITAPFTWRARICTPSSTPTLWPARRCRRSTAGCCPSIKAPCAITSASAIMSSREWPAISTNANVSSPILATISA